MTFGPHMNTKFDREDLLRELKDILELIGAKPERWPDGSRARLSALVESDDEAASLYAEAKAFDQVISCAPLVARPHSEMEARIVETAMRLPQDQIFDRERVIKGKQALLNVRTPYAARHQPNRAIWVGTALMAASLIMGVYIGMSGNAVPALQGIERLAANDAEAGIALSGSLFGPSELYDEGRL